MGGHAAHLDFFRGQGGRTPSERGADASHPGSRFLAIDAQFQASKTPAELWPGTLWGRADNDGKAQ